ncbi:hypothetical protein MKK63_22105 [Methylobacterium sp. J-088]|uniref:hypothetical protein n=1 Tax=Methylobacterium sp. J-088 TaxID=2836664 RepID=UPI001FBB655A|nr:hypothetical protein [Methylobacterium sp. J-088]MCJ2065384.1 hypothetical protein [Methylobacterium sp. J-088]
MLERIAVSLGCTTESLRTSEGLPTDLVDLDELLRRWAVLRTDEQRQHVLRAAREAAEQFTG